MPSSRILIGVPAFNGAKFIKETLQSIASQELRDFRVIISVDGNDHETAHECSPFLSDERFSLVCQTDRLGWDGNINWLMSQGEYDFFCYWQQDDYTTSNYLSELLKSSHANPSAVCHFSDIQWVGSRDNKSVSESIQGFAIQRALSVFETINGIPQRGLIRRSAIERAGPIARNKYESAFEEIVWVAKIAREGSLQRVTEPLYYKRAHSGSVHLKWLDKPRTWKRDVWMEFGLGILETIWAIVPDQERMTAVGMTLDRLCSPRQGRFLLYDGAVVPFAFDFLNIVLEQYPVPQLRSALFGGEIPVRFAGSAGGVIVDRVADWVSSGKPKLGQNAKSTRFNTGEVGIDLLLEGWSMAESWGVWSDGPTSRMRLPLPRPQKVRLSFTAFGIENNEVSIVVATDPGSIIANWKVPANNPIEKELILPPGAEVLEFSLPDAASPFSAGYSEDRRQLGIGLIELETI